VVDGYQDMEPSKWTHLSLYEKRSRLKPNRGSELSQLLLEALAIERIKMSYLGV